MKTVSLLKPLQSLRNFVRVPHQNYTPEPHAKTARLKQYLPRGLYHPTVSAILGSVEQAKAVNQQKVYTPRLSTTHYQPVEEL